MSHYPDHSSARIQASGCRTALGTAESTCAALLEGRRALELLPALGGEGGERVPVALLPGRSLEVTAPPDWLRSLDSLAAELPAEPWGTSGYPVFVTSSNFGVGNLHAFRRTHDPGHLPYGAPALMVEQLRRRLGWGNLLTIVSHACVSAHVGLWMAGRTLEAGLARLALVFSFDFLSPFVTGGFHALKILNPEMPAPYSRRATGSIGLGDGAGFVVLGRDGGDFRLGTQCLHNEMHHATGNQGDASGFAACLAPLAAASAGRRLWIKGHGTGTLESGRMEAESMDRLFPGAPLVSWKGSLGHTLGSCGVVELAIAVAALRAGRTPGTVGSAAPFLAGNVAPVPFPNASFDGVVLASNAFGGAHAAAILTHD